MNLTENGVGEVSIKSRFPGEDHRLDFGHGDSQMSQDGYVTQTGGHKESPGDGRNGPYTGPCGL
ncbi:ZNF548 isoform 7 [Pan troglodytes]|uniref:ZNF548 isoform 7 n=1 Tax=Pan troglodytes TaxID=9598 RepID=A0A2J8JLQ2_PANTR|nr:ZNF548 isoform 7 [Pan troglodytes]